VSSWAGPGGAHAELLAGHGHHVDHVHPPGDLDWSGPPQRARIGRTRAGDTGRVQPGWQRHGFDQQPVVGDLDEAGRHSDHHVGASEPTADTQLVGAQADVAVCLDAAVHLDRWTDRGHLPATVVTAGLDTASGPATGVAGGRVNRSAGVRISSA
jgi:hypothetical protein